MLNLNILFLISGINSIFSFIQDFRMHLQQWKKMLNIVIISGSKHFIFIHLTKYQQFFFTIKSYMDGIKKINQWNKIK